ncbi:hypothetical protein LOAG_13098, partial [Loa loa]
ECFPERLRLRFEPEEPFHGHIYVKGYFTHENCHLDFTRNPTVSPFDFNVLYKSPCVQKCETQEEPPNIFFHVNVIVQHHHLFLTQADSEYSVNCFYKREIESSAQEMKVNGWRTVKYASVGDRLIHKWSCESDGYGILVHSCFVHDGTTSQLVDKQGCVIDHTLMEPLIYNDDLTVAHSVVPAFKFADQLTIRFQCKVTLCNKSQSGCEGISPPNCEIVSTSTSTTELSETVPDGSTSTAESSETVPDGSTSTAESSETVPDGPTSTTEPPEALPDGSTSATESPTVPDGSTSATESTSDSNESEENSNESEGTE